MNDQVKEAKAARFSKKFKEADTQVYEGQNSGL